ncbi:unnamed protein product, partial [Ectocarpus sp. 4 AP-2014]
MSPPHKGEGGAVGAAAGGLEGDGVGVASRHERAEHFAKTTTGQGSRCACATASAPPHDPTAAAAHGLRSNGGQPQRQAPGSNPSNRAETAAMTMQPMEVEDVRGGSPAATYSGSSWAAGRCCEACGKVLTRDVHPSFACRACRKLYHRSCVGYANRSRQSPPPDWICPHCPGGERGPCPQLHPSVAGKGTVKQRKGNMPWCPICLRDDRLPNSKVVGRLNSGGGNHRRRSRGGEGGGGGGADGGAKSKAKGKRRLKVVSATGQDGGGEAGRGKGKAGQPKRRKTSSCGAADRTMGETSLSGVTSGSLNRGAAPQDEENPPARQQRARQRRASTGRGGGSNDNGNAATADPTPASAAAAAAAAAAGTVCFKCKKKRSGSNKSSGKTCGTCGRWWHNSVHCCGAYGCPESGEWVGGWRCRHCLSLWEKGLRDRAAKVVEVWNDQEATRERNAPLHRETAAAAAAESKAARRHGFSVAAVEIPPVCYPPAGILPFLDVDAIKDTGFRLARFSREDCSFMGPDCVVAKVDLCWKHRIFAIVEGAFDPQIQPLMDFLQERKSVACKLSGKAASGEASSTMGDYRSKLADRIRDGKESAKAKDNPGTFFLDTATGQADVLNWLPTDPLMKGLIPEAERGGLAEHIHGERCKFGP